MADNSVKKKKVFFEISANTCEQPASSHVEGEVDRILKGHICAGKDLSRSIKANFRPFQRSPIL